MEILINELSLKGQFNSIPEFLETSFRSFYEMFAILDQQNISPSKKYEFYEAKITANETFNDLFKKNYGVFTEFTLYKRTIDKCLKEPFWQDNQQHDSNGIYLHKNQNVTNTSLAEAFERNATLLSFVPSDFEEKQVEVSKENQYKNILNFTKKHHLLESLYENKLINFHQFCLHYFKGTKLSFQKVNLKESFDLLNNDTIENDFYNSFNVFVAMNWTDIANQSNDTGIAYKKHHKQNEFHSYQLSFEIYKFRASQKFRVFGYRKEDVFFVLEFDTTHKRSD